MDTPRTASDWLASLRPLLGELDEQDWQRLEDLESRLTNLLPGVLDQAEPTARASGLSQIRVELARQGYTMSTVPTADGGGGRPAAFQALAQFVCGFYDADLRDATGVGHGAMVDLLSSPERRRHWFARLASGDLIGIAMTERHGGSRFREISTSASRTNTGTWSLHGEKSHVSRLDESAAFVVFFRDPDGSISAALIEGSRAGLSREPSTPAGLTGWSWGTLRLQDVRLDPDTDLIGKPGEGPGLSDRHFTNYRPLVAATASGTAAAIHSKVAATLGARHRIGIVGRVRDTAYVALGRGHVRINAALLIAVGTTRLAALGDPAASLWARVGKAFAVDATAETVSALSPLVGASGFSARSPLIKARDDLAAFSFADGINDELYRSGGRDLLEG